jgi:hypothetical protein
MRRLIVVVLAAVTMAAAAHCQAKPPAAGSPGVVDPAEVKMQAHQAAKSKAELTGQPVETAPAAPRPTTPTLVLAPEDRNLPPDELRKKYKDRLGAAYVDYSATCEPARIVPGGSGTLVVMMMLKQDAVLPPSGPTKIDLQPFQGKLGLGTPQLRPARPARLAEATRGKVAFDDYAVFDIPVTVATDAKVGAHPVQLAFTYELYKGSSGAWIERFLDNVKVEVQVGSTPTVPVRDAAPTDDSAQHARSGAGNGAAAAPVVGSDAANGESGNPASGGAQDVSSMLWIAVVGGALLATLLLLVRRRGAAA